MVRLTVLLAALMQATTTEDPAFVAQRVRRAVENDSVAAATALWRRSAQNDRVSAFGLATAARLTYDYPTAERLYAQVIAGRPGTADRWSVFARLGQGLSLMARSQYERADSTLSHAIADARAISAPDASAEAFLALSQIRMRTVSALAARSMVDSATRAIAVVRRAPATSPMRSAPLEEQRGCAAASVHVRLATPGATDTARLGAARARRTGQYSVEASCLFIFAQELERKGYFDSATAILHERVAPLLRQAHNQQSLSTVLQWSGYLALQVGQYSRARQELVESVTKAEVSSNGAVLSWARLGLAELAINVGDFVTASSELRRSRALLIAQGDRWGLATELGLEARVAQGRGDFEGARAAYLATIDSIRAIGNVYATLERYRALALMEQEEGRWAEAEHWLEEGDRVALGHEAPGWTSERKLHAATNLMGLGDLRRADSILTEYLSVRKKEAADRVELYNVITRHAEVLARRGDLDGAERRLVEAADAFAEWRARQGNDREYRIALLQARKKGGYSGAGIPYAIGALARGGRIASAFRFAEERKARDLVTRIAERDAPAPTSATARPSALGATFSSASLDDVARTIGDSSALIELVAGRPTEPVTMLVISKASRRAISLAPLDSLASDGRRLSALVAAGTDAVPLAQRLGSALFGDVLSRLGPSITHLVIVPDGQLYRVPFEVLRTSDGRALIERVAVSVAPSATALVGLHRRARASGPSTLLAFGDPAYEKSPSTTTSASERLGTDFRTAFSGAGGLERLPNSAREARNVAQYFVSSDVRLGANASESALRSAALRHVSVLHFATHALVDDHVLWRSALALAPGGGYDGFVGATDLASLDLRADLVVLSGCRTAEGAVFTGEGVQGLTAPLLEAGARAVLATRWGIGDRDAGPMIDRFYSAMSKGRSAADALRDAQRSAAASGLRSSVWGAFTLVGDPTVTLVLRPH